MRERTSVTCAVLALAGLMLAMGGCKESDEGAIQATGRLLGFTGCKSRAAAADDTAGQDCLEYRYDGGTLQLKHVNAAFNCCPGDISADIRVDRGAITIREQESAAGCHCNCLFDLDLLVENLPPGDYAVQVVEPYATASDEPLAFTLHLEAGASGRLCVERGHYPWDGAAGQ